MLVGKLCVLQGCWAPCSAARSAAMSRRLSDGLVIHCNIIYDKCMYVYVYIYIYIYHNVL